MEKMRSLQVIDIYDSVNVPLLESGRHNYVHKYTIIRRHFGLNIVYRPTYGSHLDLCAMYVGALGGRISSECLKVALFVRRLRRITR
jgi:hypothetical protein